MAVQFIKQASRITWEHAVRPTPKGNSSSELQYMLFCMFPASFHSDGWLTRFNGRQNLAFRTVCRKCADNDSEVCAHWVNKWLYGALSNYSPDGILDRDKTALHYKMFPQRMLASMDDSCWGKKSNEHITVTVTANMSDTEKCWLLVMEESI